MKERDQQLEKLVENKMRRLEKELHGAWRAGYDRVHIYRDADNFSFDMYAYPSMKGEHEPVAEYRYECHYDLNSASDSEVLAAVSK